MVQTTLREAPNAFAFLVSYTHYTTLPICRCQVTSSIPTSLDFASISSCLPLTRASIPMRVEPSALSLPRTRLCSSLSPSCKDVTHCRRRGGELSVSKYDKHQA